ncbi:hypothetical protein QLX08_010109 [Tetragonisca angustula]|uniref:Uncharacterized protein n=1 Tax=Tetragonisca angustula TaxID=166442 RepID=A0AAW0ZG09_9HYME
MPPSSALEQHPSSAPPPPATGSVNTPVKTHKAPGIVKGTRDRGSYERFPKKLSAVTFDTSTWNSVEVLAIPSLRLAEFPSLKVHVFLSNFGFSTTCF